MHFNNKLIAKNKPEPIAEFMGARLPKKVRAQHGPTVQASPPATGDLPAGPLGGPGWRPDVGATARLQRLNDERQDGLKRRSLTSKTPLEATLPQ